MNFILFLIAAISLLSAFLIFDRIVKFQFESYPKEWEKSGKPSGFFSFDRRFFISEKQFEQKYQIAFVDFCERRMDEKRIFDNQKNMVDAKFCLYFLARMARSNRF